LGWLLCSVGSNGSTGAHRAALLARLSLLGAFFARKCAARA